LNLEGSEHTRDGRFLASVAENEWNVFKKVG
jgi:hypothetical protein